MLPNLVSVITMSLFSSERVDPRLPPLDPVAPSDVTVRDPPPAQLPVGQPKPPGPKRINGFGPAVRNEEKFAQGIRTHDQPKCTDPSHSDKDGWFRTKSQCRMCLKEAVETIPLTTTRWQTTRYLTALFRSYFCPFCFLEAERSEMHTVTTKSQCKKHRNLNRTYKCQHNTEWQYCKECVHDPRSATEYCLCGAKTSGIQSWAGCQCPDGVKGLSYGLRFGTNPFVVPTDATRAQEDLWASERLALAALMEVSGEVLERKKKKPRIAAPASGDV